MTGMVNLTMTLAPVIFVRNFNLTQPIVQMSSMYYNDIELTLECDTHADTRCIGNHALIPNNYDRPVTLYVYDLVLGLQ